MHSLVHHHVVILAILKWTIENWGHFFKCSDSYTFLEREQVTYWDKPPFLMHLHNLTFFFNIIQSLLYSVFKHLLIYCTYFCQLRNIAALSVTVGCTASLAVKELRWHSSERERVMSCRISRSLINMTDRPLKGLTTVVRVRNAYIHQIAMQTTHCVRKLKLFINFSKL